MALTPQGVADKWLSEWEGRVGGRVAELSRRVAERVEVVAAAHQLVDDALTGGGAAVGGLT